MSYQVLARKWRPSTFEQVVGQEHVLQSLINALEQKRLHHAYLFSGTRGVGKTSIARLLAKALNCEQGVSAAPCGECSSCVEIAQGNFVDLIEIDAASKTKVEDTREILENVQYKPTRGRYKVYLIDEVHMLSRSSFNALLKTLEEPPEHVKFLFATTETQKLPVTILSRCLQFNLKAITVDSIKQQLTHILAQESVTHDDGSLVMIAQAADGSMRDALSLTDQAISYGDGELSQVSVQLMLGTLDPNYSLKLLNLVSVGDSAQVFSLLEEINQFAPDYDKLLKQLALDLHFASMAKVVKQSVRLSNQPQPLWQLSEQVAPEQLQLFYTIVLQGRKELPWAADQRSGFEMVILRLLTFIPAQKKTEQLVQPQVKTLKGANPTKDSAPTSELALLEQQQNSIIDQAIAIKSQSATVNREVPQEQAPVPKPPISSLPKSALDTVKKANDREQLNARSQAQPIPTVAAPDISDTSASFSDEELLNMSMAMAHEDDEHIEPVDFEPPTATHDPVNHVTTPTTNSGPISGIDQFLKARKSLKQKAKAAEHVDSQERTDVSVKKPMAAKAATSPEPLLSEPLSPESHSPIPAPSIEISEEEDIVGPVTKRVVTEQTTIDDSHSSALVDDPATLLAPNTQDYWSNLIDSMALGGRIRQLGIHSSYQIDKNKVTLTLATAHRHLGVDTAVQTLQKNLSLRLELPIELDVNIGESEEQTPYSIAQDLHQLRLSLAAQCIEQDPSIIEFIEHFGATLDQSSIKYRTIKAIN